MQEAQSVPVVAQTPFTFISDSGWGFPAAKEEAAKNPLLPKKNLAFPQMPESTSVDLVLDDDSVTDQISKISISGRPGDDLAVGLT